MAVSYFAYTLFLLCLMLAGLLVAQRAGQMQGQHVNRLSRLSALETRRKQTYETARALQQMDTDADVLSLLYSSLLDDLQTIKALDPARSDLDRVTREAESGSKLKSSGSSAPGGSAAVATEEELTMTQRHLQRAMTILMRMYKDDRISASQFQSCRETVKMLGIRIAVNSCLLMAQRAVDNEDGIKALSCYRRAESFLGMKGLPREEKQEKLSYIGAEREKLFTSTGAGRGLLMLATPD